MNRVLATILAAAFFFVPARAAAAGLASGCPSTYVDLYRQTRPGKYITATDQEMMRAIRQDPGLTPEQKAKQIFRVVLTARLRGMPADTRKAVEKVFEKSKTKISASGSNGIYNVHFRSAKVWVPEFLVESAVEHMLRMHELEHALQHAELRKQGQLFLPFSVKNVLLAESDAIAAEWNYLRQIPEDILKEIDRKVKWNGEFKATRKKFLRAALRDAHKPFSVYIRNQRALGRYSKENVRGTIRQSYGMIGVAVAALVVTLYQDYGPRSEPAPEPTP